MAATDLAKMVPGFEFLQNLMKGAGAAFPGVPGVPGMGQWIAPTLNPLMPATLTLVGGSSGRTSNPALASPSVNKSRLGISSNSTHIEKLWPWNTGA